MRPAPSAWGVVDRSVKKHWPGVTVPIDDGGGRYYYDEKAAKLVCDFFPKFGSHSKGELAGTRFDLLPYQTDLILKPLFGWKRKIDGRRRFRKAYIEIPKKNGKTQLIAGLALYALLCDGEPGAEVYCAAADRHQAGILFEAAKAMVESSPGLSKRLKCYRSSIVRRDDETAFFRVLSADADTKHGFNIHCLIIDELHAQPDRVLFETLTRGVIARRQPLTLYITTAGDDDESICAEEYERSKRILSGTEPLSDYLPVVFESDPQEDFLSPEVWRRVNPALGVTITEDVFKSFADEAAGEPRKRNDFVRYHLNRWVNQATAWIPVEWWDACDAPLPSDAELATYPCAIGIDMAQKIDLTAAPIVFRLPLEADRGETVEVVTQDAMGEPVRKTLSLNYRIAILPAFWIPEDTLREHSKGDRVPYDIWRDEGLIKATGGAVIDSDAIVSYVLALPKRFPLAKQAEIGYDPAFATEIAVRLQAAGHQTVEVLQNYKNLSEACQVFEALVKARRVIHGGHRLLRWNVENVAIKQDDAGRIRPVKPRKQAKRIDGVVATIMALSRLMALPEPQEDPYAARIARGEEPIPCV